MARKGKWSPAFENKKPTISFGLDKLTHMEVAGARGIGTEEGSYKYDIALTPNDICTLLEFLGKQRNIFEDRDFNDQLRTQCHSLLCLLIASSGIPLALQPSEVLTRLANIRKQSNADEAEQT